MERNDRANFQIFHVYVYIVAGFMNLHERLIYQSHVNCGNSANHSLIPREEKQKIQRLNFVPLNNFNLKNIPHARK